MGNQATKEYSKYHRHADGRKKNVHWEEAERPHPPGQPLLVPASPGAQNDVVTIRWDPPISDGGSAITGYLVEHRRTGSPHWVRATPGAVPRCQLTLSGLEPGWRYQFRVAAENAAGRSDPSAVSEPLTVTLAKGVATAPHFSKELQDTVALENEKVDLTVRVTGTPAPKISWFKDGLEVFSGRRSRVVTDGEGTVITSTLIIHQAALADEGEIKCAATNRAGHAVTKARLRLEAPPSIRLPRQYEDGLLFELGEVIRVKVSVAGRPPPRVSWLHNGEVMRPGPRHEITTTDKGASLRVSEARRSDRGEYQVRAVNQLGEDVSAFLVTVTDRPTPPGKAMVAMTLGKSVTLSWGPPDDDGGCKIGNYIVEYNRVGWDMWLKAATCRQLTTTLGDLIEGSEYKFRVKAENPYGVSDPGDESETVFLPDPKRGIHDPPQRGADGSEQGSDWWNDRKRRRDPGAGASSEDTDDALDEKKARSDGAATGAAAGSASARKRPAPLSVDVEDVSPIPSPVPRASRATEKSLSLPRTRSAAPGAARDAAAPEPPKRRNRSVPRAGEVRDDSVSPEPDSLGSYLPTAPDEMGVVKGRLFGIHLSTDSVRSKHAAVGIEEEVYPPLASPRPSPARSPVPSSPPTSPSPGLSPGRSPRRSPIGGGEVTTRPEAKPEANGVLDLRQVEEYANKYEAKLMELERRQRELEARGRQRQLELEEEQKKELERMRRDREREQDRQKERERSSQLERNKEALANKPTTATLAAGQDRLFPRSEDGSVAGDSSEFLLVLLPNSRATTEERETTRSQTVASLRDGVDADGEPPVAPPMSLSAPELGAIDPDVPFMRNAVSSTELLHERAMARFYQEVAEEEAEKARRRRMSIERRVSLERRLSIERKNRERLKGRMDSVDEDAEDDLPVNLKRFATARPSGAAPAAAPQPRPGAAKPDRVLTSEEREQADFAALRDRLSKATKSESVDMAARRRRERDLEDELEGEELGEEEEEEDLEEEEDEYDEEDSELEEEDMPLGRYDDDHEDTYHPRFGARLLSEQDDTPPTPPPHRKASSPEPEVPLFIPRAETYTTMTEHDNVASVLLTKRHSPVKGDVKPKPILKKRGSIRKSKSPGSKSPGSKSPQRHKSPTQGTLSPMIKKKDKLERRKSTDSVDSDKSEKRRGKKAKEAVEAVRMRPKPERPPPEDDKALAVDREAMATATPEANLGISAAEAARSKRGLSTAPRRDSVKDDATKVVISHYSDLVREYGAQKPQQSKYLLSYDEIRARAVADADDSDSTERVDPAGTQHAVLPSAPASAPPPAGAQHAVLPSAPASAPPTTSASPPTEPTATLPVSAITSSSVREDLLARRESRREPSVSRKESRREPSAARRDTTASKADAPATRDVSASSSRRREPSSSRTREPSVARKEPSKRDASTSRGEPCASRRDASVSKRDSSVSKRDSSVSKRDGSVSRRDGSVSRRDGSVSRRDGSVSRRDGSVARRDGSVVRRPGGKEALGHHPYHRDRTSAERSLHRSHTSVASSTFSDDSRARTPEEEQELVRRAEENVKSTFRYATDLGMLLLAVWLYLFRSELLALPVLGLLVYRQAKEEVRRRVRVPVWLARVTARVRALGRGKATDAAGAATNPATQ